MFVLTVKLVEEELVHREIRLPNLEDGFYMGNGTTQSAQLHQAHRHKCVFGI